MERFAIKIDKNVRLNLYKICRLCGIDHMEKIPILDDMGLGPNSCVDGEVELCRKIFDCVGIQVDRNDKMPQSVCNLCHDKINDFFEFREMCASTNIQTRKLLGLPDIAKIEIKLDKSESILGLDDKKKAKTPRAKKQTKRKNSIIDDFKPEFEDELIEPSKLQRRGGLSNSRPSKKAKLDSDGVNSKKKGKNSKAKEAKAVKIEDIKIFDDDFLVLPGTSDGQQKTKRKAKSKSSKITAAAEKIEFPELAEVKADLSENIFTEICSICANAFESVLMLEQHLSTVHVPRIVPYHCMQCDETLFKSDEIKNHNLWHKLSRTPFVCGRCDKNFSSRGGYTKHTQECIAISLGLAPVKCHKCSEDFPSRQLYTWHNCTAKNLECPKCGKRFAKKLLVQKHSTKCIGATLPTVVIERIPDVDIPHISDKITSGEAVIEPNSAMETTPSVDQALTEIEEIRSTLSSPSGSKKANRIRKEDMRRCEELLKTTYMTLANIKHETESDGRTLDTVVNIEGEPAHELEMPVQRETLDKDLESEICPQPTFEPQLPVAVPQQPAAVPQQEEQIRVKQEPASSSGDEDDYYDNDDGFDRNSDDDSEEEMAIPAVSLANIKREVDDTEPVGTSDAANIEPIQPTLRLKIKKEHGTLNSSFVDRVDQSGGIRKKKKKKKKIFRIPLELARKIKQEKFERETGGHLDGMDHMPSVSEFTEMHDIRLPVISSVISGDGMSLPCESQSAGSDSIPSTSSATIRVKSEFSMFRSPTYPDYESSSSLRFRDQYDDLHRDIPPMLEIHQARIFDSNCETNVNPEINERPAIILAKTKLDDSNQRQSDAQNCTEMENRAADQSDIVANEVQNISVCENRKELSLVNETLVAITDKNHEISEITQIACTLDMGNVSRVENTPTDTRLDNAEPSAENRNQTIDGTKETSGQDKSLQNSPKKIRIKSVESCNKYLADENLSVVDSSMNKVPETENSESVKKNEEKGHKETENVTSREKNLNENTNQQKPNDVPLLKNNRKDENQDGKLQTSGEEKSTSEIQTICSSENQELPLKGLEKANKDINLDCSITKNRLPDVESTKDSSVEDTGANSININQETSDIDSVSSQSPEIRLIKSSVSKEKSSKCEVFTEVNKSPSIDEISPAERIQSENFIEKDKETISDVGTKRVSDFNLKDLHEKSRLSKTEAKQKEISTSQDKKLEISASNKVAEKDFNPKTSLNDFSGSEFASTKNIFTQEFLEDISESESLLENDDMSESPPNVPKVDAEKPADLVIKNNYESKGNNDKKLKFGENTMKSVEINSADKEILKKSTGQNTKKEQSLNFEAKVAEEVESMDVSQDDSESNENFERLNAKAKNPIECNEEKTQIKIQKQFTGDSVKEKSSKQKCVKMDVGDDEETTNSFDDWKSVSKPSGQLLKLEKSPINKLKENIDKSQLNVTQNRDLIEDDLLEENDSEINLDEDESLGIDPDDDLMDVDEESLLEEKTSQAIIKESTVGNSHINVSDHEKKKVVTEVPIKKPTNQGSVQKTLTLSGKDVASKPKTEVVKNSTKDFTQLSSVKDHKPLETNQLDDCSSQSNDESDILEAKDRPVNEEDLNLADPIVKSTVKHKVSNAIDTSNIVSVQKTSIQCPASNVNREQFPSSSKDCHSANINDDSESSISTATLKSLSDDLPEFENANLDQSKIDTRAESPPEFGHKKQDTLESNPDCDDDDKKKGKSVKSGAIFETNPKFDLSSVSERLQHNRFSKSIDEELESLSSDTDSINCSSLTKTEEEPASNFQTKDEQNVDKQTTSLDISSSGDLDLAQKLN